MLAVFMCSHNTRSTANIIHAVRYNKVTRIYRFLDNIAALGFLVMVQKQLVVMSCMRVSFNSGNFQVD